MNKFAIKIYGCQMNVYDGDRLRTAMIDRGWQETTEEEADVICFVTCSIRDKAEQKAVSEIGRHECVYKKTGSPMIVLLGCMAQRVGQEVAKKFSSVKIVSGPRHIGLVPDALERVIKTGEKEFFMDTDPRELEDLHVCPTAGTNPFKSYLTISYGCDRFCSYCIVPYVRGRLQSRAPEEILAEARQLVQNGVTEITLLGQNVDAFGKDFTDKKYSFASLLDDVSQIDGLERLRFATSHPKDFDSDILDVMKNNDKICRAINLPVQSGNTRILKEMNRGYTREDYISLVERIRNALPDVSLTTDLIVGFPTETEEEFLDSCSLLEQVKFDIVHTAAYSIRPGTRAATMEGQIDEATKNRRLNEINAIQFKIAKEANEAYIGQTMEILPDGFAPKGRGQIQGRTKTDHVVILDGTEADFGKLLTVDITGANPWSLEGKRKE